MFSYAILLLKIWQLVMNLAQGKVYMSGKMSSEVSILQKDRHFWPAVNFLLLSVICTFADLISISSIFVLCFYVAISSLSSSMKWTSHVVRMLQWLEHSHFSHLLQLLQNKGNVHGKQCLYFDSDNVFVNCQWLDDDPGNVDRRYNWHHHWSFRSKLYLHLRIILEIRWSTNETYGLKNQLRYNSVILRHLRRENLKFVNF